MGVFPTSIQYLLLGGLGSQNRIAYALLLLPASQTEKWPPRCGDKGLWGLFYWPFFVSAGLFIFSIPSVNKQGEQPSKKYESKKTFLIAKVVQNGKKKVYIVLWFSILENGYLSRWVSGPIQKGICIQSIFSVWHARRNGDEATNIPSGPIENERRRRRCFFPAIWVSLRI